MFWNLFGNVRKHFHALKFECEFRNSLVLGFPSSTSTCFPNISCSWLQHGYGHYFLDVFLLTKYVSRMDWSWHKQDIFVDSAAVIQRSHAQTNAIASTWRGLMNPSANIGSRCCICQWHTVGNNYAAYARLKATLIFVFCRGLSSGVNSHGLSGHVFLESRLMQSFPWIWIN